MITNEEIVKKLNDHRDKKAPQVNDRWIKEKATELLAFVTEETVLDELLEKPFKELEITQKAINSAFAAEAKKKALEEPQHPTPPTPPTPPTNEPKLPKEVEEFMAKYKADEAKKALEAKRNGIYDSLKTKVNEAQRNVLKKIVEMQSLTIEDSDEDISDKVMETFTDFQKTLAGDITPAAPIGNTKVEDLKKSYEEKMKQHHIGIQ